jgi:5-methylcytosine-specific restriction endonuclease McrA
MGRVRVKTIRKLAGTSKPVEEVVRQIKEGAHPSRGEEYRERSLAIHGLICGRCGRDFDAAHRHLLTIHHKDGNHHNNPPDGSNWENLCAYCHEDVHSRGILGDYLEGTTASRDQALVYRDEAAAGGMGGLAEKLKKALDKKKFPK